jgi:hypothetical protein
MTWIKISLLLLFILTAQSVAQDTRSFRMSVMIGLQFACVNTSCIPFVTVTASSARVCQRFCLNQVQCQAASFQQSTSSCLLFTNTVNQNSNLLAHAETVSMIVISETRIPPG